MRLIILLIIIILLLFVYGAFKLSGEISRKEEAMRARRYNISDRAFNAYFATKVNVKIVDILFLFQLAKEQFVIIVDIMYIEIRRSSSNMNYKKDLKTLTELVSVGKTTIPISPIIRLSCCFSYTD